MVGTIFLILIFSVFWWYLVEYIKYFNTGDPNETDFNNWKFSYDFRPDKKEDYSPDKPNILKKRRFRNKHEYSKNRSNRTHSSRSNI